MKWLKEKIQKREKITLENVILNSGDTFPLLKELIKTEQDPIWHSEGNVHIHTNMVLNEMYKIFEEYNIKESDQYILLMSAIFHDIAKPLTSKWKEIKGVQHLTSKGHEYEGMSYLCYRLLEDETITKEERTNILDLVGYHQLPKLFVVKESYNQWHYKILTERTAGKYFYYLELADMRGRETEDKDSQIEYIELFKMFASDYDCFYSKSNIDKELENLFKTNFEEKSEKALSFLIGKTKKRLFDNDILDPLVSYQKYYEHKDNHSIVYVLCGLPGSGKSTIVEKLKKTKKINTVIELDALRKNYKLKTNNKKEIEGKVRQDSKELLKRGLSSKETIIFDACNYRKDFRDAICSLVESYYGKTVLVFVQTSITDCIKNDKTRQVRTVGEHVIMEQVKKFQYPEDIEFNAVLKNF